MKKIDVHLVKDLRQGSSSFFTLKSSWSVPFIVRVAPALADPQNSYNM